MGPPLLTHSLPAYINDQTQFLANNQFCEGAQILPKLTGFAHTERIAVQQGRVELNTACAFHFGGSFSSLPLSSMYTIQHGGNRYHCYSCIKGENLRSRDDCIGNSPQLRTD